MRRALWVWRIQSVTLCRGAAEGLGIHSLVSDLWLKAEVRTWTGPNSAKAIASKRGLGETKAHRVGILVGAGDDQSRESEDQKSAQRVQFGRSCEERERLGMRLRI